MDKSLDEIIQSGEQLRQSQMGRNRRTRGEHRGGRSGHRSQRDNRHYNESGDPPERSRVVSVENLHYQLREADLDELFSRVGRVVSVEVFHNRDSESRADGRARIVFEHPRDAFNAVARFDGKSAAGQPLKLKLLPPRDFTRIVGGVQKRERGRGGRSRNSADSRQAGSRRQKTAEELDMELDDYMNNNNKDVESNQQSLSTPTETTETKFDTEPMTDKSEHAAGNVAELNSSATPLAS